MSCVSIFNTGFSWLQSWEECAKQTRLQHGFKALCWRLSLRRIAELREGRHTECVAQLARDQRSRFTLQPGFSWCNSTRNVQNKSLSI